MEIAPVSPHVNFEQVAQTANWDALVTPVVQAGADLGHTFQGSDAAFGHELVSGLLTRRQEIDPAQDRSDKDMAQRIVAARDDAHTGVALLYSTSGYGPLWDRELANWQRTVPAEQAARGAQLVHRALSISSHAAKDVKSRVARPRPFASDPQIVKIDGNAKLNPNFSFPSSHTSNSFAAAGVLAYLDPAHAGHYAQLANDVTLSRLYSGVHYVSDVLAGAWLGSAAAQRAIATQQ